MEDNETADIQIKFQRSGLLARVTLTSVSWNPCFGTKYKSKAILAYDTDPATLLLEFGKIETIYQVLGFIYFELNLIQKVFFIVSYDNLLGYYV